MAFSIPEEYRDKLQMTEVTDHRSDAEIFASFLEHRPVTSEKNVWAYWHSGVSSMPKWCQKNAIDWVRILGPEWTVRILDNVSGSPNNTLRYVPESLLPPAFVNQTMDGPYIGQHGADLTRSACLYEYGGAWMDVGSILIRHIDRICWDELENPDSPYRVAIPIIYGIMGANHFVAARKHDPFIHQWHKLFTHVWGDKKNFKGLLSHPLLTPIIPMTFEGAENHFDVDWVDQQTALDALEEDWRGEFLSNIVGFGERALNTLKLPCSGPEANPTSQEYKDAEKLIWELLSNASMWKITHAKGLTHSVHLGTLLDMPENEGKDAEPNTFGELLRYGTVYLRQTRENVVTVPKHVPSQTWKKGILEP